MTLIAMSSAWMVGIALAEWVRPPWTVPALLAVVLLLLLPLWYRLTFPVSLPPPWGKLPRRLLALALLAALGALRWCLAQPSFGPGDAAFYAGQAVELRGTVLGEGEAQAQGVTFPLEVELLGRPGQNWVSVHGTVLVQGGPFLEVAYGDRLLVAGTLEKPRSGEQSSYRDSLARQGIHVLLRDVGEVRQLPGVGGSAPGRALFAVRTWARQRIEVLLPEPQASLVVGVLLGSRTSIPAEVQEAFSRSGTSHILAISGWNINIVAAFLVAAGRRLPRPLSLAVVVVGIVLYTLLVGAGASVLRAALMGLLYVVAQQVGRPGDGCTALFASAWAMTLWNPGMLGDVGFQLSFGATLGMLLFVPIWTAAWARWPGFLAESLAATLSSQLLTWPLVALYFRQFSLVVPLSNLLACPALPPLMLFGALALLLGTVPGVGAVLGGITWLLATYMLGVVGWTGSFSWAAVPLPALGPAFLVLYYAAVGWWWRSAVLS